MKRNSIWLQNIVGMVVLAGCLAAAPALAQMNEGMGMPSNMGTQGQMQRPGQPQMPGNNMPGQQNNMNSMVDQSFLRGVSQNAQIETNLSQMAIKNSSNDNVKKLAQQVILDHQQMSSELSDAANRRNIPLSDNLPGHVRKDEKKMQALSGNDFDQAYLKELDRYVKDDQSRAESVESATNSPDMRQLTMEVQSMAQNHTHEIAEVAKAENLSLK
ncbi:MAG TPA: DUF4142 domain-containing protein [Acidobacteriaceae bacterium]|jgi:putative membrane protein|nr:DUF4142 domain-containing protein [Acidobacteriaceae bacterium]